MKHSIVLKFIAVALCAAFLFTAAGSGIGALCLTEMGLYEQTVDEVYAESRDQLAEVFANQIAQNYASQTLGGCPEEMTDNYVHFNAGCYSYTLKDAEGNVLKERSFDGTPAEAWSYSFQVQTQYQKLIEATPDSARYAATEAPTYGDLNIIDNRPGDDIMVDEIEIVHLNGDGYGYVGENLGVLYHTTNGDVFFQSHDPNMRLHSDGPVTQASFFSSGELLYQITRSDGVGEFAVDENGLLSVVFQNPELAATEPPLATGVTEPLTENPTEEPTQYPSVGLAYNLVNNIPAEGAVVGQLDYIAGNGLQSFTIGTQTGFLSYNADGAVIFRTTEPSPVKPEGDTFYYIAFYGLNGELLYEASQPIGAGTFYLDENNYLHFTSIMETANVPTEPVTQNIPTAITDNMQRLGYHVAVLTIYDEHNYTGGIKRATDFGYLIPNTDGTVTFRSYDSMDIPHHPDVIHHIEFYDAQGRLLYGVQSLEGVGSFSKNQFGMLEFITSVTSEDVAAVTPTEAPAETTQPTVTESTEPYVEPTTVPDTTTATEVVQTPVDIPQETVIAELTDPTEAPQYSPDEITGAYYYDYELGEHVHASFVYEEMPEAYTVELHLAPGAYEMDAVYDLMQFVWPYRNELLYILGVSLLGFAITAVYLCCTAGRRKDRDEPRAGGLNCVSLDVYLGAGALAVCGLAVVGFEGGYYLLRYSPKLLVPFVIIMGYAAALIVVGFCFACAAQFKTPGGYWWRNTLCFRCCKLAIMLLRWSVRSFIRFMRWLERFLGKCFPLIGKTVVWVWNTCIDFAVRIFRFADKGLTWLGHFLGKIFRRVFAWTQRFLTMLPVTWQWLITGGMLLFILFLAMLTRSESWILMGGLAGLALVIYGAHCFGVLLDSAKRMSKGNLETKVDDKLMVGAFKEFAGDLNDLADVAVISAQKQMTSERMKTELITNVSHDIKTPLTSIINYVDLLQKPHTDEEQEMYLEVLSRQSQRMKKLLEDLIEMSKASTGNMTVNITRLNAGETVAQALGEFADKLEKAQLTTLVNQPEAPVYMQADGRLAWRVLSNILSNAVKYALPGTRVYIDVTELEGKVLISVKNISREALNVSAEELMERFVRGDASRNTEGSGLGLNIAQSLMEIQKGKLQLLVDGDLFKVTLVFPGANE